MPDFKQEAIAPIQFANPVEQYKNLLKTQYLASEIEKAKRIEGEAKDTADSYSTPGAVNPDGSLNDGVITNALAQKHRGGLIPAYQKNRAEIAKVNAETGGIKATQAKTEMDTLKTAMENMGKQYSGVSMSDPHLGQQQMYALFKAEAVDPAIAKFNASHNITPDQYLERRVAEMQPAIQTPEAWRQFTIRQTMGAKEAADVLEKKLHVLDRGDKVDTIAVDPNALDQKVINLDSRSKKMADHSVKVTLNAPQYAANAFGKKLGENEADSYSAVSEIARHARTDVAELDRMIDQVKSGKVYTGIGAGALVTGNRIGKFLNQHIDQETLNNTQELQKYLSGNVLARVAALNKAGLGTRTSVMELKMMADASARGDMESGAILNILLNQRKAVQDAIPAFNSRNEDITKSTDPTMPEILKTLASHKLDEIPDHPLAQQLSSGAAPAKATHPVPTQAAIELLRQGKISKQTFEDNAHYGPGSAERYLHKK